jgi:hypothetical protein
MHEIDNNGSLGMVDLAKAQLERAAVELTPFLANAGVTADTLAAGAILLQSGGFDSVVAIMAAGRLAKYFLARKAVEYVRSRRELES